MKIAFLILEQFGAIRQKRKNNNFDGYDNIGAKIIINCLERAGKEVTFCLPETAHFFDIILVSFTSFFDTYSFLQKVIPMQTWQPGKRSFIVIAGGAGLLNPVPVRNYVDFCGFGRVHNSVNHAIDQIIKGNQINNESWTQSPNFQKVKLGQDQLYTEPIKVNKYYVDSDNWTEFFSGCIYKCKFCGYSFSRKLQESPDFDMKSSGYGDRYLGSSELMLRHILKLEKRIGFVISALDGWSERLRFLYGKHISNEQMIEAIERLGSFEEGNIIFKLYNIVNFPYETEHDYFEFLQHIRKAKPKNKVFINVHNTAFVPMHFTPMQWEKVNLFPDWSQRIRKNKNHYILNNAHLSVVHELGTSGIYNHLQRTIAIRADKEDDQIIAEIALNKKLRAATNERKYNYLLSKYNLDKFTNEQNIDDSFPYDFIETYMTPEKIRSLAKNMRKRRTKLFSLEKPEENID